MTAPLDSGNFVMRQFARPLALGVAMFVTARYSMSFLHVAPGVSGFWFAHGLALAALLRAPARQWPMLIIGALAGTIAAGIANQASPLPTILLRSLVSASQYFLCAWLLRRRCGRYFDLLDISHLVSLAAVGAATTVLKVGLQIALLDSLRFDAIIAGGHLFDWLLTNFLGLFVLSLPLLAISARSARSDSRFDATALALTAFLVFQLWLIFGPVAFVGLYTVMPVLMILAWRNGLFGAGVALLATVVAVCTFNHFSGGIADRLTTAGYSDAERGTYLALFFLVATLTSLPLAVARARKLATDRALAAALAAAEARAAQLVESEAAARASADILQTTENRWRAALEGSGLGVWDWNIAAGSFYYSTVWKAMRGYADDEIGTSEGEWTHRLHPEDLPSARAAVAAHLAGETPAYHSEHRVLCRDGGFKWVLDRGMVFERDAGGTALRMIGTSTDIDAMKRAAERSERHASLYLALAACNAALARRGSLDSLAATICEILVANGKIRMAWVGLVDPETGLFEPAAAYAMDGDIGAVTGRRMSAREDGPDGQGAPGRAFRSNEPQWIDEFGTDPRTPAWRDRERSLGWRGGAALPLRRRGAPIGVLALYTDQAGYFDDNTRALLSDMASQFSLALDTLDAEEAARQFQESLSMSEQRFRAMFEASPFGVALMDTVDGDFLTVNPMYATIVGWPADELLAMTWQDITHPDDLEPDRHLAEQFIAGAIPGYQFEKRYMRKDGKPVWVHMTVARFVLPGQDERQQHLCMIEDVSERKALESRIHFAQQMDAIGQLTGGVAHDFNNLLTIVIGSSETLTEQLASPQHRKLATLILEAAERGSELIRRLLAFARRQPLQPHPFDVNELLESMVRLIRRALGADLKVSIETAPDLCAAFADPAQTESAILNMCLNARDAMPDGGTLTIRTDNVTLAEDYVHRHPEALPGDYVAISISDTGTGIAPDVIGHIFEPFFTTKETGKGTGLGLSMVYGFVQQSKGHLEVASIPGEGTTFTLYLPRAEAGADMIGLPGERGDAVEEGTEHVLIVEDDDLVRQHVRSLFESLGYTVAEAATGGEALAILESSDDIDLLFTDIVMPGGMNGRQLGEKAVERWPWLRVLYTSGYSRDMLSPDGRLLDDVRLLSKPYSKRQLSEKVRKVLDEVP